MEDLAERNVPCQSQVCLEDEPLLLTVLRELLEFGGHSVVTCGNGREAVQQLSVTQFDLGITDLSMPDWS